MCPLGTGEVKFHGMIRSSQSQCSNMAAWRKFSVTKSERKTEENPQHEEMYANTSRAPRI